MAGEVGHPITLVSPRTGEVLSLDSPTEDLAGLIADLREHKSLTDEALNCVQAEILRRMDTEAKWTVNLGPWKITGKSPKPKETWDGAELRSRLLELVDQKALTIQAVDMVVEQVLEHKVNKAGVNSLRSLGGEAAEIVNELAVEEPERRYVRVERGL